MKKVLLAAVAAVTLATGAQALTPANSDLAQDIIAITKDQLSMVKAQLEHRWGVPPTQSWSDVGALMADRYHRELGNCLERAQGDRPTVEVCRQVFSAQAEALKAWQGEHAAKYGRADGDHAVALGTGA
jgi:hypothetical protein